MLRAFIGVLLFTLATAVPLESGDVASDEPQKDEYDDSCVCGVSGEQQTYVVGGVETKTNELPWTVALSLKRSSSWLDIFYPPTQKRRPQVFCGGTLINSCYVATAAHCVKGMDGGRMEILINEHNLMTQDETVLPTYKVAVETIIVHPEYNQKNVQNDIALIKLAEPLPLSEKKVRPVCLQKKKDSLEGKTAIAAGWGKLSESGKLANVLNKVHVPIVANSKCNSAYDNMITDKMLCAGIEQGGKDTCQGDSGGPLIMEEKGGYNLVGIVSWGYGCARPKFPGVYTRVSEYVAWIYKNAKGCKWCPDLHSVNQNIPSSPSTTAAPEPAPSSSSPAPSPEPADAPSPSTEPTAPSSSAAPPVSEEPAGTEPAIADEIVADENEEPAATTPLAVAE